MLRKLLDLSGLWQGHPWAPPCPRLAKIVMLSGREPGRQPCQRAFARVGSKYPNLPGRLVWREEKASKKGLEEWEEVERGDPGRESLERGKCLEAWLGRRGWWRCRVRR